jgi:hypothetical protein
MDKVRKPNISVCYTPSSEPYSIYCYFIIYLIRIILLRHTSYNDDDLEAPSGAVNN